MNRRLITLGLLFLMVWGLSSSLYVINETQTGLLIRIGKPMGSVGEPGLKFKIPFIDSVVYYDSRLLPMEPPSDQIILGDQKRIVVDRLSPP